MCGFEVADKLQSQRRRLSDNIRLLFASLPDLVLPFSAYDVLLQNHSISATYRCGLRLQTVFDSGLTATAAMGSFAKLAA